MLRFHVALIVSAVGLAFGYLAPARGQTLWTSVLSLEAELQQFQQVAQRFTGGSIQPDLIIDGGVSDFGSSLSIHDQTIFSATFGQGQEINRWDALSGERLSPLHLRTSVKSQTGGSYGFITALDHSPNGDLLFARSSVGFEQRNVARYSPTGDHLMNYVHPNLQHVQGSMVATDDHVFVISRYGSLAAPLERVLMFSAGGDYVGDFEVPVGAPRDLAVWDDQLVVLGVSDDSAHPELGGLNVYTLGPRDALPEFSHTVDVPEGVALETHLGDGVGYVNDTFYVSDSRSGKLHKISERGELLTTFETQLLGDSRGVITDFVVVVPEPSGVALLLIAGCAAVACAPRSECS